MSRQSPEQKRASRLSSQAYKRFVALMQSASPVATEGLVPNRNGRYYDPKEFENIAAMLEEAVSLVTGIDSEFHRYTRATHLDWAGRYHEALEIYETLHFYKESSRRQVAVMLILLGRDSEGQALIDKCNEEVRSGRKRGDVMEREEIMEFHFLGF